MKYRSRTEIVSMILDATNGGATKTKIMYSAFLIYNQREYLSILIQNNLLEYHGGNKILRTTEKGLKFIRIQNDIGELLQTTTIKND